MRKTTTQEIELVNPSLSNEERISIVNRELQMLLDHFDRKADKAKNSFHFYKYASIFLAGATSVISSFELIYESRFPGWILPVISAAATITVAMLGASSAQRLWINSRTTGQQLQVKKFLFNQQAGKYYNLSNEDRVRIFSERMIQIWNEGHGKWEQTVNEG
ncbi:MAG: DUF4231 domain-containing protein [Saprospiraceae bacterium]|nr:DUF4231 domain-containing protein [Saprospiraceae bacterium]